MLGIKHDLSTGEVSEHKIPESEVELYVQDNKKMALELVRQKRNNLLASSDWTQLSDSPADKIAWQVYRQALRDIPEQASFPDSITWPEAPQ